jgi:hypothetical protein
MFNLIYPWKSFQINLNALAQYMHSHSNYHGMSADSKLTLHFSEEPTQQTKDYIQMHFDAMTEENQTELYIADAARALAKSRAEANLANQSWDAMIPAERKIILRQELNTSDLDALVSKYIGG